MASSPWAHIINSGEGRKPKREVPICGGGGDSKPAPQPKTIYATMPADVSNGQQRQAALISSTGTAQPSGQSFGSELSGSATGRPAGRAAPAAG